jgi:hypothetical protein
MDIGARRPFEVGVGGFAGQWVVICARWVMFVIGVFQLYSRRFFFRLTHVCCSLDGHKGETIPICGVCFCVPNMELHRSRAIHQVWNVNVEVSPRMNGGEGSILRRQAHFVSLPFG